MKLRTIHRSQYNSKLKKLLSRGLILVMILSNIPAHSFANSVNTEENKYIEELSNIKTKENLEKSAQKAVESGDIDTWITGLANISSNRVHLESATINNKIYIFGGASNSSNTNVLNNLEVYDPATNQWETKTDMPTGRLNPGSVVFNNKIYCIGGLGKSGRIGTVEVYDPATNQWEAKTSMPTARDGFVAEVVNGKIYCIGGRTASGVYTNVFEVYDINTDRWETKTPIATAKGFMSSAVVGDNIYCIGGIDGNALNTVDIYNTTTDTWKTKSPMPTERYSSATSAVDGKIYIMGGRNSNSYIDTVEAYNVSKNSWERKTSIPTARAYSSSSVINDKIYLFGGYDGVSYFNTVEAYITGPTKEKIAEEAVYKAEQTIDPIDIENAKNLVNQLPDSSKKEELLNRLNALMPKTSTSNIDVYIVPSNILTLSLDTNSVTFKDFDGVEDMEMPNAINLKIESTLPYTVDASLETEIQNKDRSSVLDKSILGIKSNNSSNYQTFTSIKTPITLLDVNDIQESNSHSIDLKLNKNVSYKIDVYKTAIKFEVTQK